MCYLNARYYDPELCRFISADDVAYLDPETVNGLNLYAYCGNNPVMNVDESGNSRGSFREGVGNWFKKNWKQVVIGAVVIVVGAVVSAETAGAASGFFAAFGSALLSSAIQTGISMGISAVIGGAMSAITGGSFWDGFLTV